MNDVDLVGNFHATQDGHERPLRVGNHIAEVLNLLGDQRSDHAWFAGHGLGDGDHGGVLAVAGAEGIIAVDVAQFGQGGGELGIAFFLARFKPQIFHDQHLASGQGRCLLHGIRPDGVGGKLDVAF